MITATTQEIQNCQLTRLKLRIQQPVSIRALNSASTLIAELFRYFGKRQMIYNFNFTQLPIFVFECPYLNYRSLHRKRILQMSNTIMSMAHDWFMRKFELTVLLRMPQSHKLLCLRPSTEKLEYLLKYSFFEKPLFQMYQCVCH